MNNPLTRTLPLLAALVTVTAQCGMDPPTPPERERLRVMIPSSYQKQIKDLLTSGVRPFSFKYEDVDWVEMPWYTGRDAVFAPSLAARFADSDPDADVMFLDLYRLGSFRPSWLTPMDTGPLSTVEQDFRPAFLGAARLADGRVYAIPWSAQANFLYYRSDLIKTPPRSWKELRHQCEGLRPPQGMRYCLLLNWDSLENDLYPVLWSVGATGSSLDTDPVVDLATQFAGWFGDDLAASFKMLPAPRQAPGIGRDVHKRFLGGESAFMITWSNRYQFMLDEAKSSGVPLPATGIAAVPPAAGDTAFSNVGTWGWIVPAGRRKPTPISQDRHDRAMRFVQEVSSREAVEYLVRTTGLLPARTDVPMPAHFTSVLEPTVRRALDSNTLEPTFAFRDRGADAFTHGFIRDAFRDVALCRISLNRAIPSGLLGDCARYHEDCLIAEAPTTNCLRKAIARRLRAAQRNVLVVSPEADTE